jgi:hypothetical protein
MKLRPLARDRWLLMLGSLAALVVWGCAQGTPPEPTTRDAGRDAPSPLMPDAYTPASPMRT